MSSGAALISYSLLYVGPLVLLDILRNDSNVHIDSFLGAAPHLNTGLFFGQKSLPFRLRVESGAKERKGEAHTKTKTMAEAGHVAIGSCSFSCDSEAAWFPGDMSAHFQATH